MVINGRCTYVWSVIVLLVLTAGAPLYGQERVGTVEVALSEGYQEETITGRLLLFFASSSNPEPRFGPNIFNPEPVFAIEVTDWSGDEPISFEPGDFTTPPAKAFPRPLGDLESGAYYVQALLDRDTTRRSYASGSGNLYSEVSPITFDPSAAPTHELVLDHIVTPDTAESTEWVRRVEIRSQLLTDFHGEEINMRAGVILPPGYTEDVDRQYPAVYVIPGFGGRHTDAWQWIDSPAGEEWKQGDWPMPMIRVVLDPDTPLGHSTFANSANNGPVGDALVEELIPAIEEQFRLISEPGARFVKGHSSGGWASLWLQINYPGFFGGTWSTAPDPVDFRAFQVVNIYEDDNAYWTDTGHAIPSVRHHGNIVLTIRDENRMEYVTGPGGQWDSWHAVFGPRGEDGQPIPLWDKLTGDIDPNVAEYWTQYDIRRKLKENWSTLAPQLRGKLHIVGGTEDNFYLNRSLKLLKDFLDTTDYEGYVEIQAGDHGSFLTPDLRRRFYREMKESFDNRPE